MGVVVRTIRTEAGRGRLLGGEGAERKRLAKRQVSPVLTLNLALLPLPILWADLRSTPASCAAPSYIGPDVAAAQKRAVARSLKAHSGHLGRTECPVKRGAAESPNTSQWGRPGHQHQRWHSTGSLVSRMANTSLSLAGTI